MEPDRNLSVIALHGIATCEAEIEQTEGPVVRYAGGPGISWLFPRAERRNLTVLGGNSALAWYDVATYDRTHLDKAGIEEATEMVCRIVREERARHFCGRRVVLMGFSLGGALALHAGLRLQGEVDGIIALATALPLLDHLEDATPLSPPLFFGHGILDTKVPWTLGRESQRLLAERHYDTEWHSYAYGHATGKRQLSDVSQWLCRRFAVVGSAAAPGGEIERAAQSAPASTAIAA